MHLWGKIQSLNKALTPNKSQHTLYALPSSPSKVSMHLSSSSRRHRSKLKPYLFQRPRTTREMQNRDFPSTMREWQPRNRSGLSRSQRIRLSMLALRTQKKNNSPKNHRSPLSLVEAAPKKQNQVKPMDPHPLMPPPNLLRPTSTLSKLFRLAKDLAPTRASIKSQHHLPP